MVDPADIERYNAMVKQLNVPQGELVKFIFTQVQEEREKRRLQWEQEFTERCRREEERFQKKNELPMRK